jgi:hypothetical protein
VTSAEVDDVVEDEVEDEDEDEQELTGGGGIGSPE